MNHSFPPVPEPLPAPVLDSHCHLDLLDVPVSEVLAAAHAAGVRRVVTVGVDVASSHRAADTARMYDDVWAAAAIHPNEADGADDDALEEIAKIAQRDAVRAVGETGLDYYRDWSDRSAQQRSFRAHIGIAKRLGKTLVIHDRDAHADVLRILDEEGPPDRVVFHCFSGDAAMARECADRGYVLSFAGNVTFTNAGALREAAAATPPGSLLVETDVPFLTPVPYRGKPNAPYLVPLTVRCLAEVKGMSVPDLCGAVEATGERLFGPW